MLIYLMPATGFKAGAVLASEVAPTERPGVQAMPDWRPPELSDLLPAVDLMRGARP